MNTAIASELQRLDYLRRTSRQLRGATMHKEWMHFCVLGERVRLLVNFSFSDDVFPHAKPSAEIARLTFLMHDEDGWDGDVLTVSAEHVYAQSGGLRIVLGSSSMSFDGARYVLDVRLPDRDVELFIELTPSVRPAIAPNIPLTEGPPLHWTVVPRMLANGYVRRGARVHRLEGARAYHDHNWGEFLWGHDLSWEWGFCIPDDETVAWSFACVRLSNRARTETLAQGIFVWRGVERVRTYRDGDVRVDSSAKCLRQSSVFKVPAVMDLVFPDRCTDVPERYRMTAVESISDTIAFDFHTQSLAQVVIPTERRLGVTVINEAHGLFEVSGVIDGERIDFKGEGFFEFLTA